MAIEAKRNETRSFRHSYRGWVAIHAPAGFPQSAKEWASHGLCRKVLNDAGFPNVGSLPLGEFVCVVELTGMVTTNSFYDRLWIGPTCELEPQEKEFGNYNRDRWAWTTANCRRIDPGIPFKGMQGLYGLPEPIIAEIVERTGIPPCYPNSVRVTCPLCGKMLVRWDYQTAEFTQLYGCNDCRTGPVSDKEYAPKSRQAYS
jgi:predicted RNA-binding Zn-ribbon protein involved in translation (DUF1610 family)